MTTVRLVILRVSENRQTVCAGITRNRDSVSRRMAGCLRCLTVVCPENGGRGTTEP